MKKLSHEKIAQVLSEVPGALRKLAEERDAALMKLASIQKRQGAEKLAAAMHKKGLDTDTEFTALADRLEKAASEGKFQRIHDAVELVGPDMGTKIAQLSNDETRAVSGTSDFERFIYGDVG
jgi:hypothetical protein